MMVLVIGRSLLLRHGVFRITGMLLDMVDKENRGEQ